MIRCKGDLIRKQIETHPVGALGISSITESELRHGAERSADPAKNHHVLDRLLLTLPSIPFGPEAATKYGSIRNELERLGTPIGSMDLLIAAHAMALGTILVTNNTREFSRVNGLQLADWSR